MEEEEGEGGGRGDLQLCTRWDVRHKEICPGRRIDALRATIRCFRAPPLAAILRPRSLVLQTAASGGVQWLLQLL